MLPKKKTGKKNKNRVMNTRDSDEKKNEDVKSKLQLKAGSISFCSIFIIQKWYPM